MTYTKSIIDKNKVRDVHLFHSLNDARLEQIIDSTRVIKLTEGEALFEINQEAHRFYLVIQGQIKLFRVSEEGNEKIIEIVHPGKIFAEAVVFMEKHRYPVNATALRPTELYAFDNSVLLDLLKGSNKLCFALMADLSRRLHARLEEIDTLTLQNASCRVVHFLAENLTEPKTQTHPVVIDLATPKHAIASKLSITPETLSRILHTMAKEDILKIQGRKIEIKDLNRLWKFARAEKASYAASRM